MDSSNHKLLLHTVHFVAGGAAYGILELVWRGYTHISMIMAGGFGFLLLLFLSKSGHNLLSLSTFGAACITAVEFAIGCVVNLWLGLEIWDYSEEYFHLFGQICPLFSFFWGVLCAVMIPVCRKLRRWEEHFLLHFTGFRLPLHKQN